MSGVFTTATRLRIAVAAVVVMVNAFQGGGALVLPWALLVLACDLIAGFVLTHADVLMPHRSRRAASAATMAGALCAGLSTLTGPGALPLFVIPLFRAGEALGRRVVGLTTAALATGAFVGGSLSSGSSLTPMQLLVWGAVAAGLGILASWEERIAPAAARRDPVADEAAVLLDRLAELSGSLEGGLDPATLAERILDELPRRPRQRSAVLVGPAGGHAVPVALRGAARVPWPEPQLDDESPLGRAWMQGDAGAAGVDERTMVAAPLVDSQGIQVGVLVSDWSGPLALAQDVAAAVGAAERHGASLAVALAYAALRDQAGVEERRQLARTMHDGIAQEVAALGFQLDMVRYAAQRAGDHTAAELVTLRAEVARILADLRTDITDLRIGLRPQDGLGAAISNRLQHFGSVTGCAVTVSLRESAFRLPVATEIALYRIFLDALSDAQRHHASSVDASLVVAAPHFVLTISHDAAGSLVADTLAGRLSAEASVEVRIAPGGAMDDDEPAGVRTTVTARSTAAGRGQGGAEESAGLGTARGGTATPSPRGLAVAS